MGSSTEDALQKERHKAAMKENTTQDRLKKGPECAPSLLMSDTRQKGRMDFLPPIPFIIIFLLWFGHWIRTSELKGSVAECALQVRFETDLHKTVRAVAPKCVSLVCSWGSSHPAQGTLIQAWHGVGRKAGC